MTMVMNLRQLDEVRLRNLYEIALDRAFRHRIFKCDVYHEARMEVDLAKDELRARGLLDEDD